MPDFFKDKDSGTAIKQKLNDFYDAFVASGYPANAGMFAPGTLSEPSVRGSGDTDTGINLPGSNTIDIVAGGVQLARGTPSGFFSPSGSPFLTKDNTLGLFSQGSVIESGENANGTYYKLVGGMMICQKRFDGVVMDQVKGGVVTSLSQTWTFPSTFVFFPSVFGNEESGAGGGWSALGSAATTTTGTSFVLVRPTSSAAGASLTLTAIGYSV